MKKIKIKISKEGAEELADLKIKLGFEKIGNRDKLIKEGQQEMECLFG